MSRKLPIDFSQKVKQAPAVGGNGYPYRISAADLMNNFKYVLDQIPAEGDSMPVGYSKNEMIRFDGAKWVVVPSPSASGTLTLGSVDGSLEWILDLIPPGTAENQMIRFDGSNWVVFPAPSASGTRVLGSVAGSMQWILDLIPAGTAANQIIRFDGTNWVVLAAPSGSGTFVLGSVNGTMQWLATEECA